MATVGFWVVLRNFGIFAVFILFFVVVCVAFVLCLTCGVVWFGGWFGVVSGFSFV